MLAADAEEALFNALKPAPMPAERAALIKSRVLSRAKAARTPQLGTIRSAEGEWKPFLPKIAIKVLRREAGSQSYLLRLDPGAALLPHEHPDDEECVVLEGEVRIGDIVASKGDYHLAPKGVAHGAIVSEQGALLFLRGAIPAASQVRWASVGAVAALAPDALKRFFRNW
jgi:quercetin dioxygenase-like cupin family protein